MRRFALACVLWCGLWYGHGCYHMDRQYGDGGAADGDSDSDADGDGDPFSDYGCFDDVVSDDMCEIMICDSLYGYYEDMLEECLSGDELMCLILEVCFMPYADCMIEACPSEDQFDDDAMMDCAEAYAECAQEIMD